MNDPTPPPPGLKSQAPAWTQDGPAAPSASGAVGSSRKYWWLPVLTLLLGLGVALAWVSWRPPTYVSRGSMWVAPAVPLLEGKQATGDLQEFLATQADLLKSGTIAGRAFDRLRRASGTNAVAPSDKDGRPTRPRLKVSRNAKSSVFIIEASSASPDYVVAYLDALMGEFLAYKRDTHSAAALGTYTAVSDQIKRQEEDLRNVQEALAEYAKSNNVAVLEEHAKATAQYLAKLITQLSELKLEDAVTRGRESSPAETAAHQALKLKMEYLEKSIKEFEAKLDDISRRVSEADRLKQRVQRMEELHPSLLRLLQKLDLSRNLSQESLYILDRASPAERDYRGEKCSIATGGLGGLGVGLVLAMLLGLSRASRRTPKAPHL